MGSGAFRRGRDRDGAFQYSRRGLRLRRRGAYGIHRASGPMDAKGCVARLHPTGKTTHYILCVAPLLQNVFAVHRFAQGAADWRSGPRWSIISVLCPVHPFPLRGTSPQGETRDMREKTASHILQVPFRRFPPLVAGATTFPPCWEACHTILRSLCFLTNRVPLPPLFRGHYKALKSSPFISSFTA